MSNAKQKPLNCPKGYGLCWGCKVHCDHPQASEINMTVRSDSCLCGQELRSESEQRNGVCRECL